MKTKGSIILGVAMIAAAILMEMFWISTGKVILGIFTLAAAFAASCALARYIQLDYESSDTKLRRFLTVTGLEY